MMLRLAALILVASIPIARSMTGRSEVIHGKDYRPCPYNALSISVTSDVRLDTTGADTVYTYTYTVRNLRSSGNAVDMLAITPIPRPLETADPPGWIHLYDFEGDAMAMAWGVVGNDTAHAPNLRLQPENIRPGRATTGFVIKSHEPPVPVRFYAQGFDTLPRGRDDFGLVRNQSMFELGVTGRVLGPKAGVGQVVPGPGAGKN